MILCNGEVMKVETYHGPDTDEELFLKRQIADLQEAYRKEAAPLAKRLADIHALKPPRYFIISEPGDAAIQAVKNLTRPY